MRSITIAFMILFSACQASVAAPRVFQDHNFAIELPVNWQPLDPPPAETLAVSQTSDSLKTILVIAKKLPANDLPNAARDMSAGAKQSATDKGWQISNEHDTSFSGVPFHAFTTRISASASMVTYVGVAGNEGYMLQAICKMGDAGSDPEVQTSVSSFRLLSPRNITLTTTRPNSTAYRTGYVFGELLVVALIGTGFVWLIRKVKKPHVH
jgi:hypothetical protein